MRGAPAAIAVHCPSRPLLRIVGSSVVSTTNGCAHAIIIEHSGVPENGDNVAHERPLA